MFTVPIEDVCAFMNSPEVNEDEERVAQMKTLFESMPNSVEKERCRRTFADLVLKGLERERAMDQGFIDKEVFFCVEWADMSGLEPDLRRWFPELSDAEQKIVIEHAYALHMHFLRQMRAN